MILYHVVEERGSLHLIKQGISLEYAQTVRRKLWMRYPGRKYKIVAVDVWNQFLKALDRF